MACTNIPDVMSVDIGDVIGEGIERTLARNGLILVAISFLLGALSALFSASITRRIVLQQQAMGPMQMSPAAPAIGLSAPAAGLLSILVGLASLVFVTGAVRTFVTDETEQLSSDDFTRNLLLVVVNLIIGGIVFGVVVGIGFILLIVPGIFLLVSLFFWNVFVIVDDENFIDAFGSSWRLTSGNRLTLFGLGLIVVVIGAAINFAFGIPSAFLPRSIGFLVAQVGSAFVSVFTLATATRTYVQLTAAESPE